MKVLILSDCPLGMIDAWKMHGYEAILDKNQLADNSNDEVFEQISKIVTLEDIEFVFTFNFLPQISEACEKLGYVYVSWITDSPHIQLMTKSVYNRVNRIFTFDRVQCQRLLYMGVENAYHMPICVSSLAFENVISKDGGRLRKHFGDDVSFVGNLYDSAPFDLYDRIKYMPGFIKGYIDAAISAQRYIWGMNVLDKVIDDSIINEVKKYVKVDTNDLFLDGYYDLFFKGIVHKKIAQLERKEVCENLSKLCSFSLYSGSDVSYEPAIKNKGKVDYYQEMPLVFAYSKININITLHSIESGIPMRVMDILACGGFCLTNYQTEIAEYFEDGRDLVIYSDFQDMYKKIDYYLKNESERIRIAKNGNKKIKELFDINEGIGKILQMLSQ